MSNILDELAHITSDNFSVPAQEVQASTHFENDLGSDSLQMVSFVMDVENRFEVTLTDEDIYRFKTVGDVEKKLKELGAKL